MKKLLLLLLVVGSCAQQPLFAQGLPRVSVGIYLIAQFLPYEAKYGEFVVAAIYSVMLAEITASTRAHPDDMLTDRSKYVIDTMITGEGRKAVVHMLDILQQAPEWERQEAIRVFQLRYYYFDLNAQFYLVYRDDAMRYR